MNKLEKCGVLVAGIGGASLGTELLKSLGASEGWSVIGCDISPLAYGHYGRVAAETFVVREDHYIDDVLEVCRKHKIRIIIPGGEKPLSILCRNAERLKHEAILLAANDPEVIALCSDKERFFNRLRDLDLPLPWTLVVTKAEEIVGRTDFPLPCIIKPCTGTGGSRSVFLASNRDEAVLFARSIESAGQKILVQEYVSHEEGEFTVGVLSAPDKKVLGSVAMKRIFHTKLSVLSESSTGLISTGYSQGLIDSFPDVCAQAEAYAVALGSAGPLNVQARMKNKVLLPFEVNPRFSASTYLRTMAGFNEVDIFLQCLLGRGVHSPTKIEAGYYLRSLDEQFIPLDGVRK